MTPFTATLRKLNKEYLVFFFLQL